MKHHIKISILVLLFILLLSVFIFVFLKDKENKPSQDNSNNIENNNPSERGENMEQQKIKLFINNHELTATLNNNSSSKALVEKLKKGSITIKMQDYANMEKVGDLGFNLPRNDEDITTSPGDLILYQGSNFVIYYNDNNWSLTKLGKIDNVDAKELKSILGDGDVTIKLYLER